MIMTWINLNFQNPNSISMFKMIHFHNILMIIMINIIIICIIIMKFNLINKFNNKIMLENQIMEILWTVIPLIMITIIMFKSINLLYLNQEIKMNFILIKIFSNQWFWNYEYPNFNLNFNSYLMYNNNFNFYLIETDNNLIIPFNYQILFILTSLDVIHSWTIPSINIKMDSIPNQLNSFNIQIMYPQILYGQCSEICGINHSFMPIKMESININQFLKWIN